MHWRSSWQLPNPPQLVASSGSSTATMISAMVARRPPDNSRHGPRAHDLAAAQRRIMFQIDSEILCRSLIAAMVTDGVRRTSPSQPLPCGKRLWSLIAHHLNH
jgi:hypothetical protein